MRSQNGYISSQTRSHLCGVKWEKLCISYMLFFSPDSSYGLCMSGHIVIGHKPCDRLHYESISLGFLWSVRSRYEQYPRIVICVHDRSHLEVSWSIIWFMIGRTKNLLNSLVFFTLDLQSLIQVVQGSSNSFQTMSKSLERWGWILCSKLPICAFLGFEIDVDT